MVRINIGGSVRPRLGFGLELWDTDPDNYEGCRELRARHASAGQAPTSSNLVAELSAPLLDDVIGAAGGAEYAITNLRAAVADLSHWVADNGIIDQTHGNVPHSLGHEAAHRAWYAFVDLVIWARALEERLGRKPRQIKGQPKLRAQGLLPALAPGPLKDQVGRLRKDLLRAAFSDLRPVANYVLHQGLPTHPFSGAQLDASGSVTLPIRRTRSGPWATDPHKADGLTYAEDVWESVQAFIDGLLDAFEAAVPQRLRRDGP